MDRRTTSTPLGRRSGWLARARHVLGWPVRVIRRERRARKIVARRRSRAAVEREIADGFEQLRAFRKTADYEREVADSAAAARYEERVRRIETRLRALIRARSILRAREIDDALARQASSRTTNRRGRIRDRLSALGRLFE